MAIGTWSGTENPNRPQPSSRSLLFCFVLFCFSVCFLSFLFFFSLYFPVCDSPDEIRRRMTKTSDGGKWFGTRWAVMCGPIAGCFIAFNIDAAGPTRRARFGCQQNGCRVAAGTTLKASSPPLPLPIWRPPKRRCSVLVIARSSQRPIDADDKKKLVAFLAKPHAAAFHPVWRFFFDLLDSEASHWWTMTSL